MIPVTFSQLRANMAKLFDRIDADRDELVVTRRNREAMVIVPLSEWEGMKETLHLLSTPANAEHLRESMAELEAGGGVERALLRP